jgi:Domain of unknown function (DUF4129)
VNTRIVDQRTTWTVVAMEAALALPIMSLAVQGDRLPGLAGPLLLLALLPAGCAAVFRIAPLRDPSWRLLAGIGLALATRAVVEYVPQPGLPGLTVWFARSVLPAVVGIALWWRGGALAVAELTPGDVRNEFSIIALCLLVTLAFARPFLLPDAMLLGSAVGLFALGGLIGAALSRQDAADIAAPRLGRVLAIGTSILPAVVAVVLVGSLRPELLTRMWLLLARAIELVLTPIGWLVYWLSSLFPRTVPQALPTPQPVPTRPPIDPAALADAQERMAWLGTLVLIILLAAAAAAALVVARMLLTNFIRDPNTLQPEVSAGEEMVVESSGSPGGEAADLVGWLMRWLRSRFAGRGARAPGISRRDVAAADSWTAYQHLLRWADEQGLGRRPAETTGQLGTRLSHQVPDAAATVDLVTRAFEWERYGGVPTAAERLRGIREELGRLVSR